MRQFFQELKRRNMFRVGVAYLVVGWLLAQVAGTLENALNLPHWFDTTIVATLLIGLPVALAAGLGLRCHARRSEARDRGPRRPRPALAVAGST